MCAVLIRIYIYISALVKPIAIFGEVKALNIGEVNNYRLQLWRETKPQAPISANGAQKQTH